MNAIYLEENWSVYALGRYKFVEREESAGQYYIALELDSPLPVDAASYKLNVKNSAGEANANLKLNFDGRTICFSIKLHHNICLTII